MNDVYAIFADMMGFADALEQLSPSQHEQLEQSFMYSDAEIMPLERVDAPGLVFRNQRYFAESVKRFTELSLHRGAIHSVILFSDSAYVVARDVRHTTMLAVDLMCELLSLSVPLRIGIGRGTFSRLSFSAFTHPDGFLSVEAPFAGTSIVNAFRAESSRDACGFRILVHPSAVAQNSRQFVSLPPEEASDFATHEVNFMSPRWPLNVRPSSRPTPEVIERLRESVRSPRALRHYDATIAMMRRSGAAGWPR